MSARFFDSLRKALLQAYHHRSLIESKFIMGHEFSIDLRAGYDFSVVSQLNYIRLAKGCYDEINSFMELFIKDNDNVDGNFFKPYENKGLQGKSIYEFCGNNDNDNDGDIIFYTMEDCTDRYIAMRFDINSNCPTETFNVFIEFICDTLSKLWQWCNIDRDDNRAALSCDTAFVLQRVGLANDVIKIIESQLYYIVRAGRLLPLSALD